MYCHYDKVNRARLVLPIHVALLKIQMVDVGRMCSSCFLNLPSSESTTLQETNRAQHGLIPANPEVQGEEHCFLQGKTSIWCNKTKVRSITIHVTDISCVLVNSLHRTGGRLEAHEQDQLFSHFFAEQFFRQDTGLTFSFSA